VKIEDLRNIRIDDVLGREKVKPIPKLLMKNITDKNVLVTGAGGSIGSELCKQVIILKAKKIILVESSELALYKIEKELRNLKLDCEIQPHLCSITDRATIKRIYKAYKVQTVYHAAAYKHVPLVELNILEGIKNNVLGTVNCALSAMEADVETFVLISSDKAVRPTNIMGATKRISELVLQGLSNIKNNTTFSMVRFGNVIDSSGSVVPLFRDQIKNGGPVTLTDKRITRYFMTIHEAVELVIQAGAMANGGEVFVLDMGEPVKIYDLAQKMIYLSGLEERNDKNESGEIEIQITGLRPGEKLYEELLIDNNSFPTEHSRILKAREYQLDWDVIEDHISLFRDTIEKHDVTEAIKIVSNIVKGYSPVNATADLLYLKNKEL